MNLTWIYIGCFIPAFVLASSTKPRKRLHKHNHQLYPSTSPLSILFDRHGYTTPRKVNNSKVSSKEENLTFNERIPQNTTTEVDVNATTFDTASIPATIKQVSTTENSASTGKRTFIGSFFPPEPFTNQQVFHNLTIHHFHYSRYVFPGLTIGETILIILLAILVVAVVVGICIIILRKAGSGINQNIENYQVGRTNQVTYSSNDGSSDEHALIT